MGFFSKIGKGLKNAAKWTGKKAMPVVSKVAGTAAAVSAFVPVVGTVGSAALMGVSAGAKLLSSKPSLSSISDVANMASSVGIGGKTMSTASTMLNNVRETYLGTGNKPVVVATPTRLLGPVNTAAANSTSVAPAELNPSFLSKEQWWKVGGAVTGAAVKTLMDEKIIKNPVDDSGVQAGVGAFASQYAQTKSVKDYIWWIILAVVGLLLLFFTFGRRSNVTVVGGGGGYRR